VNILWRVAYLVARKAGGTIDREPEERLEHAMSLVVNSEHREIDPSERRLVAYRWKCVCGETHQ